MSRTHVTAAPAAVIRVALLDDHPAVLRGLQRLLEPVRDLQVIAVAGDAVTLARELDGRRVDVLILDYDPGRGDALGVCRRIKSRPAAPCVLFYTAYTSPALVIAARAAQADGLVDKSEPARVLLDAIRRVTGGETVIPPVDPGAFEAAAARLDERDLPVFELLLHGVPTTGLAALLASDERDTARRAQRVVRRLRPRPGTMQSPRVDQRPTGPPSA